MNDDDPRHPGEQTMAAFIDGKLPRNEIAAVTEHLSGCEECRTVVIGVARLERTEEPQPVPIPIPIPKPVPVRPVAAAIAAVLAGAALLMGMRADPIKRLIRSAPADHRLLEPRLARFPWARLQPPSRGQSAPDPDDLELAGVAGKVLKQTRDKTDPKSRHASGLAYLLTGSTNESVASLEQAAQASDDWRTWNDLAAARYVAAMSAESRPSQLPQALADADRALRLSPTAAEAHFNRALILEAMGLQNEARKVWEQYLALDPSSEWTHEARTHLRRLPPQSLRFDWPLLDTMTVDEAVRRFPRDVRRKAEGPLLADWADAEAARDGARATALLSRARAIGGALARFRAERMLGDTVAAIDRADPASRAALAGTHRMYRDARRIYEKRFTVEAERRFRSVAASFARGGSPMADVASYYAASAVFDQGRVDEGREQLAALLGTIDGDRHRALRAEIGWELTVCSNAAGDWGSAARYGTQAAERFRFLGEETAALLMDGFAAMAIEMIGDGDLAWRLRRQTFAGLSAEGERHHLATVLHTAAMTLAATGRYAAAVAVLELLETEELDPAQIAFSSANRARYAARSGDFHGGQRALVRARAHMERIEDPAIRESVRAQIALASAVSSNSGDARLAIAELDRSIRFFAAGEARIDLPDAYLQRARAQRAAGDDTRALADYATALAEVEKQRTSLQYREAQLRFLDVASHTIEETIDLRLTRGDVAGAFAVADRARMLIDPQPVTGTTTSIPALPEGVLVIEYAVLPRKTVAFCVSRRGIAVESIAIERHELESRVLAFAGRMRMRPRIPVEEVQEEAAALRSVLIEPLQPHLAGVRELIIVPDRQLHALPFAALWNESSRRHLIEEFTLRFAPSATLSRGFAAMPPQQMALVIADPPAAPYPQLRASREEAGHVAAMYGRVTLLAGEAATRAAFVERARDSTLIHFAGHANSDATLSHGALRFAAAGDDSGILGSSEVAQLRLERSPLVVLAACGTLRGAPLHISGMSSLSRAFLVAGARGVVGTLWEVDDDVAAQLFRGFHAHLRAGMPPAEALRTAQIDMLRSPEPRLAHPATWSPVGLLTDV